MRGAFILGLRVVLAALLTVSTFGVAANLDQGDAGSGLSIEQRIPLMGCTSRRSMRGRLWVAGGRW